MTEDMVRRHERAARLRFLLWRAAEESTKKGFRGGVSASEARRIHVENWEIELAHLVMRHGPHIGMNANEGK